MFRAQPPGRRLCRPSTLSGVRACTAKLAMLPHLKEDLVGQEVEGAACSDLGGVWRLNLLARSTPPRHGALRAPHKYQDVQASRGRKIWSTSHDSLHH